MKIGIVTQPLLHNYGGILQNFALQQVLEQLGHSPITFDQVDGICPLHIRILSYIKWSVLKIFGIRRKIYNPYTQIELFCNKYITSTRKAKSIKDFKRFNRKFSPYAYIVGSDQVWRPKYNHFLYACFLNFTNCRKKIAYAASFGTDEWEFSEEETAKCKKLLQEFSRISVREESGMALLRSHLNISDAKHVLDPTMLLSADFYTSKLGLIDCSEDYCFTYILDASKEKQDFIKQYLQRSSLIEISAGFDQNGDKTKILSIQEWLNGIKNAKVVICDSFHGVVFSILFNRSFWVLQNPDRGNTRIESILNMLGLQSRLISNPNDINKISDDIDWAKVISILESKREHSMNFLTNALSNES